MNSEKFYKIENFVEEGYGEIIDVNKKYLVKNTIKNELVKLKLDKSKKYQIAEFIIEPSISRRSPVCKHFLLCGNCQLQQFDRDSYRNFKINILEKYLDKAGYKIHPEIKFVDLEEFTRRKASFMVDYDSQPISIGFFQEFSNKIINIEECFIVTKNIFKLMNIIRDELSRLLRNYKIFRIIITEIDEKLDVIFETNIFLDNEASKILTKFAQDQKISRIISNFNGIFNIVTQNEIIKKLGLDYQIKLPIRYFIQATQKMEDILIENITKWIKIGEKIIDLYSGFGFLAMRLAQFASIECYEISEDMIEAIKEANSLYKRNFPLTYYKRDLEAAPLTSDYISKFDHLIINPPRKGFYKQVKEIAKSNCKKITLISCNAANFSRDCFYLKKAEYKIQEIIIIDQFLYSSHLEFIVSFTKF